MHQQQQVCNIKEIVQLAG